MPLFELESSRRGRLRVFVRAQLPFALGTVYIALVTLTIGAADLSTWPMIVGLVVAAAATVAAVLVPWERHAPSWMMTVAIGDIVVVALFRAELMSALPAVTMLGIFPILWLAYGFPWYGMAVAVAGTAFITSFPFLYVRSWPSTAVEWANIVSLPVLIVGVAVIVFVAARHLRGSSQRLEHAHRAQSVALTDAQNAEAIALGILNTVNAAVAFYDREGRLDVANAQAYEMTELVGFHLDRPPYAGDNVLAADRVSTIPYDQQIIPRALRGETLDDHLEWLGPPDAQMAIIASSRPVRREDGSLLGTVIVAYDVTELADAIEVREQFLRTVSHELRTPITSITGFLDLIDEAVDPADKKLRGYVEIVTRKTNDLLDRVGDLLSANDGVPTPAPTDLDVADVVRQAAARVRELSASRDVGVELIGPQTLPVRADRDELVTAVTELLTNAVKFGDAGAPVTVAYGAAHGRLTIAVADRGVGISAAEQRRVFDRFYRAPSARSRAIQGFGLGLTNVRAIASAHGGRVLIDSHPGEHTTFTMDLPYVPAVYASGAPEMSPRNQSRASTNTSSEYRSG